MTDPKVSEKEMVEWLNEEIRLGNNRLPKFDKEKLVGLIPYLKKRIEMMLALRSAIEERGRLRAEMWELKQEVGPISNAAIKYWKGKNAMVSNVLRIIRDFKLDGEEKP